MTNYKYIINIYTIIKIEGRKMEEGKSILTPKLWVYLVIFSVILSIIGVLSAPFTPAWAWSNLFTPFSAPMIILFILLIIGKVFPAFLKPLTRQKLGLLYAVASMSIILCNSWNPYSIVHNAVNGRLNTYDWHPATWLVKDNPVFGPVNRDAVTPILTGGVATPWADWSPFLGWWLAYVICWLLFWVGWMALLEERWIEVEKLPFPTALTGTLPIMLITSGGENPEERTRLKSFLIGVLLGALIILPIVARSINSAVPDIWGWTQSPYLPWALGIISVGNMPGFLSSAFPVLSFLVVNPMQYAFFYLLPIKILFSVWFFALVCILLPSQIAFYMGYYTALAQTGDRFHAFQQGEPFKWIGIGLGAYVGLIIMWFVLNVPFLKSTFRKSEQPERGALPGPLGWIMILVSTIAILGLLLFAGTNILGAILIVFTMWVLYLSFARVYGLGGGGGMTDWTNLPFLTKYLYTPPGYAGSDLAYVRTPEFTTTMWLTNRWTGVPIGYNNGMIPTIPMCYRVGYETGVHARDITKIVIVSGILSALIGFPIAIWYSYTVGTNNWPMGQYDAWWHWVFDAPWGNINSGLGISEPILPHIIAGVILLVVLSVLNFRFIWWPLDPAGVVLTFGTMGTAWVLPAFAAWLVKKIVFRVGGIKLNDNVAMPIAVGIVLGYWFMMFIGAIIGTVQFFMPT